MNSSAAMTALPIGDSPKLKLLFNGSALTQGGSLQVAVNFVEQAQLDSAVDWHFAVSRALHRELEQAAVASAALQQKMLLCDKSPAKSLAARGRVRRIATELGADAVFTLFGPAYVRFPMPHVMGFANSWVTHANALAIATLPGALKRLQFQVAAHYKRQWLKAADRWIVEADAARVGLQRKVGIDPDRIHVVPNGCRDEFKRIRTAASDLAAADTVRILYISSYYRHKNFEIVPPVAAALRRLRPALAFEFLLTLEPDSAPANAIRAAAEQLGCAEHIRFTGRVPIAEACRLYESAHIAFIPTLLESFSAAYSEALSCGLPIVTSDLDFAHSICGDAALYFDPRDAAAAAVALGRVIDDEALRKRLTQAGVRIAGQLPDAAQKYRLYKAAIARCLEQTA